jgi:hypothetical protein
LVRSIGNTEGNLECVKVGWYWLLNTEELDEWTEVATEVMNASSTRDEAKLAFLRIIGSIEGFAAETSNGT